MYDHVKFAGGVTKVVTPLVKELRIAASYTFRGAAFKRSTDKTSNGKQASEWWNCNLEKKKSQLERQFEKDEVIANDLAQKAELDSGFALLKKSNMLRKFQKKNVDEIDVKISELFQKP